MFVGFRGMCLSLIRHQGCRGMCLTRFAHLDLKFPFFLLQYACCKFLSQYAYCDVQYGCNMHIAMQYGFFSSKSEGFKRSLNFFAICILRVACILRLNPAHTQRVFFDQPTNGVGGCLWHVFWQRERVQSRIY